jgi:hypothetical protein
MKGARSWLVLWACRADTRDFCSALTALVAAHYNIFCPQPTLFQFLCPHRQLPGQTAVLGHLSLSVCLWLHQAEKEAARIELKSDCGYAQHPWGSTLLTYSEEDNFY